MRYYGYKPYAEGEKEVLISCISRIPELANRTNDVMFVKNINNMIKKLKETSCRSDDILTILIKEIKDKKKEYKSEEERIIEKSKTKEWKIKILVPDSDWATNVD